VEKQSVPILPEEQAFCAGKTAEDRLIALHKYSRAKGLCLKCAEKWNRDHTCAPTVQLNAVQDLLDLFHNFDSTDALSEHESSDHLFLALSKEVVSGTDGPRTMSSRVSFRAMRCSSWLTLAVLILFSVLTLLLPCKELINCSLQCLCKWPMVNY